MNDNILAYLLLILMVYLIFKISRNTCNGFNVGSQMEPPPILPSGPPKITLQPYDKNSSRFFYRLKKAYNDPTSNGVFASMIFNNPTLKQNFMNQVKLLKDNLTYDTPKIYLDGSGSIIRKDSYITLYGTQCNFGFIWDTDWLKPTNKKPLVSCLFPSDADTAPFEPCVQINFGSPGQPSVDYCSKKAANISKPNRCSTGISRWYDSGDSAIPGVNPNDCTRNIGYRFHKLTLKDPNAYVYNLGLSENCFKTMVKDWRQIPGSPPWATGTLESYNEAVFLDDVGSDGIEVSDGFKELNKLNRPLPSALLFNYSLKNPNEVCMNKSSTNYNYYINVLKVLKSTFTPDTVVIKIQGNTNKELRNFNIIQFKDNDYTTLDKMPGYNDI